MTIQNAILFFRKHFEVIFWTSGLLALAIMDPTKDQDFSFCIFKFIGIHHCPGCGLGHSVSYILHGNVRQSFNAHPLGIFALAVIFQRVTKLVFIANHYFHQKLIL